MKKFIYSIFMLSIFLCGFTSCDSCSPKEDPEEVLITSQNFNELVDTVNVAVMTVYPNVSYYESYAKIDSTDSIKKEIIIQNNTFYSVYGFPHANACIIASIKDGKINMQKEGPWGECFYMTPYVPCNTSDVYEIFEKNDLVKMLVKGAPIILRHQLYYNEPEPRYFVGTIAKLHTVGTFTGKVDVPLGEGLQDSLQFSNMFKEY